MLLILMAQFTWNVEKISVFYTPIIIKPWTNTASALLVAQRKDLFHSKTLLYHGHVIKAGSLFIIATPTWSIHPEVAILDLHGHC